MAVTALMAAGVVASAAPASATTGDIGYLDQSWAGATNAPTQDKPQSKLWWNAGSWWADMFDTVSKTWHIFRLDRSTEKWVDTGVLIDSRPNTLADTMWDGSHLYIASHVVAMSTEANPVPSTPGNPAYLYRYSYSGGTYTLDPGFPATITDQSSESMTIDKDSTGTIWATWTQVSSDGTTNSTYVNSTTADDSTWGTPFVLPSGTGLTPDDISAVVAFGKSKVGVMWSNQADQTVYWSVHNDGSPVGNWNTQPALRGNKQADDHLNLKAIQADTAGRVFAAVKTSEDELTPANASNPQILLLVFKPGTGSWTSSVYSTVGDCQTRPQVVLDEQHSVVHVLASGPSDSGCLDDTGAIYDKSVPMDNPTFDPGRGTMVLRDGLGIGKSSEYINNVTTSKQPVNGTTGLVLLAGSTATQRYWHADISLASNADTTAPTTPGPVTAKAWTNEVDISWAASSDNIGVTGYRIYRDGGTTPVATVDGSTLIYKDTTVAASTTYTYNVTAVDAAGNESTPGTASVTTPPPGGTTLSFSPTDDATIESANPATVSTQVTRLVAKSTPTDALLKFNVTGTASCAVNTATLQLTVGGATNDDSVYGGDIYPVTDNTWSESTVTWNTRPTAGSTKVASVTTPVALNGTYTWNVTSLVKGDGPVSMMLGSTSDDAVKYLSKEAGGAAPQLLVSCGGSAPDTFAPTTPGAFTATASSATQVDLAWTASTDNAAVTGYRVYRNGMPTPLATLDATTLTYSDKTALASTSYAYQVSAVDAAGNESAKASAYLTTPAATGSATQTIGVTDDATVDSSNSTVNYGSSTRLGVDNLPSTNTLLKFNITGTSTCTVTNATLTLTVGSSLNDNSDYGGDVYGVSSTSWSESTVTWATKPAAGTTKVASVTTPVALNGTYTWDVTSLVLKNGDGPLSMQLSSTSDDGAKYLSKEAGSGAPQLAITCSGGPADRVAPSTPTGLTAKASSATQVDLAWTASTDDVGVTGYRIYRNGGTIPFATVDGSTLTYSDTTALASTAYSYQVTAIDAGGNESGAASAYITTPAAAGSTTQTFGAIDDATVDSSNSTVNYGSSTRLGVDNLPSTNTLLKFNVTGTSTCTISNATLSLTVGSSLNDNSDYGGDVYGVSDTTWSESTVTWATKPAAGTTKVASVATVVALNTTYTWDVTSLIKDDGKVSMLLSSTSDDGAKYLSKEAGTGAPMLSVTCSGPPPDRTAPSAPTGLTAKASSATQVDLAWTASTDNVGVTGYKVYRNGSTTALATVDGSTTTYSDTTAKASTSYTYQVSAVDAAGNESTKASASATTPAPPDTTAPTTPGSFKATAASATQVNLTWTASTDAVGVTGYRIYRNGSTTPLTTVSGTTLSYSDKTVVGSTAYTYQVSAIDAAGNESTKASASVTTPAPPDTTAPSTPGSLAATAPSPTQVNLTWTASTDNVGVTGYRIYRNGSTTALASVSGTTLSYSDKTVAPKTTYTYQVAAVDAAGNVSAKASASITTPADTTAPTAPTGLTGTSPNNKTINLSWSASTDNVGVTGYRIYRNGSTTPLATVSGTTLSYSDKTVAANTSYTYQVSAVDAAGNESAKASVTVKSKD